MASLQLLHIYLRILIWLLNVNYLLSERKHYVTYTAYVSDRDLLLRLHYHVTQARIVYPNFEGRGAERWYKELIKHVKIYYFLLACSARG